MNGKSTRTKKSNKKESKSKSTKNNTHNEPPSRSGRSVGSASNNVSYVERIDYGVPRFSGSGSCRIRKREFISNIPATSQFSVQKYEVNPGDSTTFPWLSGIAPNFEKYRFHKLGFIFQTSQSTFVPGTVIMAPEFNVTDPLPTSKPQILEYSYAKRSAVWENFSVHLKTEDVMNFKTYYTRVTAQVVNDLKLYDPLYWIIGTDGLSEDLNIAGELWVEYDVEFTLPQRLNSSFIDKQLYKTFDWTGGNYDNILGTNIVGTFGGLNITFDQPNATFTFPSGFAGYLINETAEKFAGNTGYTYTYMNNNIVNGGSSGIMGSMRGYQLGSGDDLENSCQYCSLDIQPGGTLTYNNNCFSTAQTTGNPNFFGKVLFLQGPATDINPSVLTRKKDVKVVDEKEIEKKLRE